MDLQDFINNFAEQFDETDVNEFSAETAFKKLEEWSSLHALWNCKLILDKKFCKFKQMKIIANKYDN